jgi:hypothetical protein
VSLRTQVLLRMISSSITGVGPGKVVERRQLIKCSHNCRLTPSLF